MFTKVNCEYVEIPILKHDFSGLDEVQAKRLGLCLQCMSQNVGHLSITDKVFFEDILSKK